MNPPYKQYRRPAAGVALSSLLLRATDPNLEEIGLHEELEKHLSSSSSDSLVEGSQRGRGGGVEIKV